MKGYWKAACAAIVLVGTMGAADAKSKLGRTDVAMYQGKSPPQAASAAARNAIAKRAMAASRPRN